MPLLIWPYPLSDNLLHPAPTERTLEMLTRAFLSLEKCKVLELEPKSEVVFGHGTSTCHQTASQPSQELENNVKMQRRRAWNKAAENLDLLEPKIFLFSFGLLILF